MTRHRGVSWSMDVDREVSVTHHHLVWPAGGDAIHVSGGTETFLVRPPDAVWIRAAVPLTIRARSEVGIARFRAPSCPASWSRNAHLILDPGVTSLLEWLPAQVTRPWAPDVASAVTEQIALAHARTSVALPLPTDPSVRRAAMALLDDPSDRRDASEWAAEIGYAVRTFRRRFVVETGLAFTHWRAELRLRTAMSMLSSGERVETVARRCGYASATSFARAFRASTGLPPSRFSSDDGRSVQELRGDWPPVRDSTVQAGQVNLRLPVNPTIPRRSAALAAAGLVLLAAACGSDDDETDSTSPSASTGEAVDETAGGSAVSDPPDVEQESEDPSAEPAAASGTVTIEHAAGTAVVPAEPERVATISEVVAGHLLSVGIVPVAGPTAVGDWLQPYVDAGLVGDPDLSTIADIGFFGEFNLEALVESDPEVIIVEDWAIDSFEELDAIAPTVVVELPSNSDWQTAFDQTVAAVGADDAADEVRARYEALLDEVPESASDSVVTFIRGRAEGTFRLDALGGFGGSVAEAAGYRLDCGSASEDECRAGPVEFSNERLDVVTGDILVTTARRADESSSIQELIDGPLWETIPAVADGRIVELPQPVYNGGTYVAAELLLRAVIDAT
ncbi:MAG: helix-turn-helix domain-containing protein [Actinomycetota bacterium]